MKTNLRDTTFLIPVRIDSIIRIENCLMVTQFLLRNFDCKVIVLEASSYNSGILPKMLDKRIQYYFVEDKDDVFYRTKYLNQMTRKVETQFLGIWDADVIAPKNQIVDALNKLRTREYEVVLPYDGRFLDTSFIIREYYYIHKNIKILLKNQDKMDLIYGTQIKGGAILINTEAYRKSGMENENFYGWGSEDFERYARWTNLGYNIHRINGPLFHFTHPRTLNSTFRSLYQKDLTNREVFLTYNRSKSEQLKFIDNNFK